MATPCQGPPLPATTTETGPTAPGAATAPGGARPAGPPVPAATPAPRPQHHRGRAGTQGARFFSKNRRSSGSDQKTIWLPRSLTRTQPSTLTGRSIMWQCVAWQSIFSHSRGLTWPHTQGTQASVLHSQHRKSDTYLQLQKSNAIGGTQIKGFPA